MAQIGLCGADVKLVLRLASSSHNALNLINELAQVEGFGKNL